MSDCSTPSAASPRPKGWPSWPKLGRGSPIRISRTAAPSPPDPTRGGFAKTGRAEGGPEGGHGPGRGAGDLFGQQFGGVGPEQEPTGPVPRGHPDVFPAGDGAGHGAVVGGGWAEPDPGLEVPGGGQSRGHDEALPEELVQPDRGHAGVETRPHFEGPAAGHPSTGPGHQIMRQEWLDNGPA